LLKADDLHVIAKCLMRLRASQLCSKFEAGAVVRFAATISREDYNARLGSRTVWVHAGDVDFVIHSDDNNCCLQREITDGRRERYEFQY
jgi:hypothetical protein